MDKGSQKFFALLKIFSLFQYASLFGDSGSVAIDTVISPSAVYIPKEDLSEDFQSENNDSTEPPQGGAPNKPNLGSGKSNKLEFSDLEQLQRLEKSGATSDGLRGKELHYPQYLRPKKPSFESTNMHDTGSRTNLDELKLKIESYENKMENIERLLQNKNTEPIEKKDEKYESLARSLKQEIEEIKKLIDKKGYLLGNASEPKEDTYSENEQEYDNGQYEHSLNQNYDYIREEDEYHEQDQQHFHSESQVIRELGDRITRSEDTIDNNSRILRELDDRFTRSEDTIDNNSRILRELDDRFTHSEDTIDNNSQVLRGLNDRVTHNEDAILALQKELMNLHNNNNENNSLEDIELNLSSIEKIINELKERIEKTEESHKENENKINNKQDEINALEKRLKENENIISTLQKELTASERQDPLTKGHKEIKGNGEAKSLAIRSAEALTVPEQSKESSVTKGIEPLLEEKMTVKEMPHKNTEKMTGIKPANFQIYPDTYSNNYNFKEKGDNFAFRKPNKYYVEIEPTKSLYRAREIYELISKHHIKNYFINPSLKHKETFFRNLIEIESTNEIDSLYKDLESEFKDIRVIK
ncbi:hypothetical protein [Borrelia sp. P9F1]|uniref:hypothetical protein n=1 Tax=Borrelia sp. P9F1 TaxID=3058374 RepID=UPI00264A1B30|nr:hypothetical protein [Borrelia sp. P9F1]WKC58103.1 hypothetical protein QYZ68_02840 [Borrelia sp. P9F1]